MATFTYGLENSSAKQIYSIQNKQIITQNKQINIQTLFPSSGWFGDGEYGRKYLKFSGADRNNPHSSPSSIKITYEFGPNRYAGICWQNKANNWGQKPGNNYDQRGFTKVSFWAKGETGEEIVEFKSGGINDPKEQYRDSFEATTGQVSLSQEWTPYTIDLTGEDLQSVIGGFCWVASADYNSGKKMTFYIDDIILE